MPGRRIFGPQLAAESLAAEVAVRHDLMAVVGEGQFGLHQNPTLAQRRGDGVGGAGEAQQHRAVNRIDGAPAHDRRVPLAAIDGRGLAVGDFEQVAVPADLRRGAHRRERRREHGARGSQEAGSCRMYRHRCRTLR